LGWIWELLLLFLFVVASQMQRREKVLAPSIKPGPVPSMRSVNLHLPLLRSAVMARGEGGVVQRQMQMLGGSGEY
jgi:hypothetical protein